MTRLDEREIIRIFAKRLGIAELDDVCRVGSNLVLKCDMLVSSTDVPAQMKPWQIARKSVVSCASDLAAKGAKPIAAMISLGIPKTADSKFVRGLADGVARASREFGVKIVGGDTNESSELVIDCCMIGNIGSNMVSRAGAHPGDVVVVSGLFGLPAAGLKILLKGSHASNSFGRRAIRSVMEPAPRQEFGAALAKYFSSSIDSSDGLATSLYELARGSGTDMTIDNIPAAPGIEGFASDNGLDSRDLVFHGGEEYEIVATIPQQVFGRAKLSAKKSGVNMHAIGVTSRGSGNVYVGKERLQDRGYTHFSRR